MAARRRKIEGKGFGQRFVALGALGSTLVYLARRPMASGIILCGIVVIGAGVYVTGYIGPHRTKNQTAAETPQATAAPRAPAQTSVAASPAHEDKIAALLNDPAPARAIVARRDPSLESWFVKSYLRCWKPPASLPAGDYAAQIRVVHNDNGSLGGAPVLVNPPTDPAWRAFSDSAIRAVKNCDLQVPAQYLSHFDQWKKMTLHFAPDNPPQ